MVGRGLAPNVVTYHTLIDGFCKDGRVEDAKVLVNEMVGRALAPNVVTYTALINGFCKDGRVEDAEALVKEMVGRGLAPDVVTYNTLIDGFCPKGKFDAAYGFLEEVVVKGREPDCRTHAGFINGLCKGGKVEDVKMVEKFLSRIALQKGGKIKPSVSNNGEENLFLEKESKATAKEPEAAAFGFGCTNGTHGAAKDAMEEWHDQQATDSSNINFEVMHHIF